MLEILRITYPRNLSGHITPLKFVISFNNIQININIFWGVFYLFVLFIKYKFLILYINIPLSHRYFTPQGPRRPLTHTKALILINNMAYFA